MDKELIAKIAGILSLKENITPGVWSWKKGVGLDVNSEILVSDVDGQELKLHAQNIIDREAITRLPEILGVLQEVLDTCTTK